MSVYSNAFCNEDLSPGDCGTMENDNTYMPKNGSIYVRESKYELDSIAAFLKLSRNYFESTDDLSIFDDDWLKTIKLILKALKY